MAAAEKELRNWIDDGREPNSYFLQKFRLYETRSKFYMIGRDKNRTFWRVLKIDRLEPVELNILEDSTTYTETECCDLLKRLHEGNRSTGGLKFVTTCYGIVGLFKFLGPHYMLLVTKRRKIGSICGQTIYAITKSEMIPIPNSNVQSNMANSKNENRYKKLLCTVDLTKDFFFSYSYHAMHSLQRNLCNSGSGQFHYETMFVWNEFLTRGIRNNLKNTLWTVALVYGFFKQVKFSVSGRDFKFTLIARRSRHYAGTRYLKRGVNEKGRVANEVETEQIVFEDVPAGCPMRISSVVQIRGSIPLFWSQESSRLNIKPDIILSKQDHNYEATRLHFQNLVKRYGNPIIILNLIKTNEKKPRESILRAEFANAIRFINKDLTEEDRLRFLHWDLHRYSKNKDINVLEILGRVAAYALNLTSIFYCQVTPDLTPEGLLNWPYIEENDGDDSSVRNLFNKKEDVDNLEVEVNDGNGNGCGNHNVKAPMFQKGVLRTNCIDCLDRTNVAQYGYGLVALGFVFFGNDDIFSERRGQWKAATQSQEFFRTMQRYYSNAYMDAEKQDAINVFLGHFQPQQGKPALWELDSDQHYNVGRRGPYFANDDYRSFIKRSLSDGNIRSEGDSTVTGTVVGHHQPLSGKARESNKGLSESTPEISACESDISYSRYTPSFPCRQLFRDMLQDRCLGSGYFCYSEHPDARNCSNFLDVDRLSSSGNSCEEESNERSIAGISSETLVDDLKIDTIASASESGSSMKGMQQTGTELTHDEVPNSFAHWVTHGEMLFR